MMSPNAKMLENLGVEASIGKANQEACGVGEAEIGNPYDRVFHGLLMMMVVMMLYHHHSRSHRFCRKMKMNV